MKDGVYKGVGNGNNGKIELEVTVKDGQMTAIDLLNNSETSGLSSNVMAKVPAAIIAAQSVDVDVDGISGATNSTRGIKEAVQDALGIVEEKDTTAVEKEVWYDETYFKEEPITEIDETYNFDVVVVGAGNGGCVSAVSAAELGAQVAWVEQNDGPIMWAGEISAINSKVAQEEYGISYSEAEKGKIINDISQYGSYEVDQRLIKLWADHSGRTMDWYTEKMKAKGLGMFIETDLLESDMYLSVPVTHTVYADEFKELGPNNMGSAQANPLWVEYAQEMGVENYFEHTARQLVRNDASQVTGIIVERNSDGAIIQLNASKGVILATGGYSGNTEMMDALNYRSKDTIVNNMGGAGHQGDGIKMAINAGAMIDRNHAGGVAFNRGAVDLDHHVGEPYGNGLNDIWWPGSQPWLKVNTRGERFMNEEGPYDYQINGGLMQPGHFWFQIFDANYWSDVQAFHTTICSRVVVAPGARNSEVLPGVAPCTTQEEFEERFMKTSLENGKLKKADTLLDLAEQLNIPGATLERTVARYNELAYEGLDKDFGKSNRALLPIEKGPFYGIAVGNWLLCTFNGVRINTNMQAINEEGDGIEGLYMVGNDSGGFFSNSYPQYYGGLAQGRTTCFARLAALHAVTGTIHEEYIRI